MSDLTPLLMLSMEIGPMVRALHGWEPVAMLAEQLEATASDSDCMTAQQVQRARDWARRWKGLPAGLRAFYVDATLADGPCSGALWHVLNGTTLLMGSAVKGSAHQRYRETYGHKPPWSLFPRVP